MLYADDLILTAERRVYAIKIPKLKYAMEVKFKDEYSKN